MKNSIFQYSSFNKLSEFCKLFISENQKLERLKKQKKPLCFGSSCMAAKRAAAVLCNICRLKEYYLPNFFYHDWGTFLGRKTPKSMQMHKSIWRGFHPNFVTIVLDPFHVVMLGFCQIQEDANSEL